jgi:dihydroorotate dehydrogenase (NAD+) catalytic subunit
MRTALGSLAVDSPIFTASGCAAAGRELDQYFDITKIGGITTKSIMLEPRSGRPTPRMAETPSGMLNGIGLQGPGVEEFIKNDLAWLQQRGATVVVSIAGGSVEEFAALANRLRHVEGIGAIEVNISCPNVASRGQVFACDPRASSSVIHAVRRHTSALMPIFAKLSPDVTDITEIADSCLRAGADGISLINTTLGMVLDRDTLRPLLAGRTGGLSGPAIRPMALRCVWQVRHAFPDVPILGMGGIATGEDALAMLAAGANAVSVGTAIFNDPSAPTRIHRELALALDARHIRSVRDVIGVAHRDPAEFRLES